MGARSGQALFPVESTTRALVDRLTARALAQGLTAADGESEVLAAEELISMAEGDDLAVVLALQRIRRGMYTRPDSVVLERAGRALHRALARRGARPREARPREVA